MEFDVYNSLDVVFGIANVQSESCKLTVGYFLSDTKLTILLPESCYFCEKSSGCSRKFGVQIIRKINEKNKGKISYFLM